MLFDDEICCISLAIWKWIHTAEHSSAVDMWTKKQSQLFPKIYINLWSPEYCAVTSSSTRLMRTFCFDPLMIISILIGPTPMTVMLFPLRNLNTQPTHQSSMVRVDTYYKNFRQSNTISAEDPYWIDYQSSQPWKVTLVSLPDEENYLERETEMGGVL